MLELEHEHAARFLDQAIQHFMPGERSRTRVLDFGCGSGELATTLASFGYPASGCDVKRYWDVTNGTERLHVIEQSPYRLPFEDNVFDVVVSTSVLEHAQNKEEIFPEIHRVLAPRGLAMHLYPSKWYIPTEPHVYVPLVNMLWPNCPRWWLSCWAILGVRNEYQSEMPWREVRNVNLRYCREGLSYWSHRRYRRLSVQVFGNYYDATWFFVKNGYGGLVRMSHALRLPAWLGGQISSMFRMSFLINRKS
jgi:SAM-dependent methyltransferase